MAYIKSEFIENLLDDVRIKDVISDHVKLTKRGANWFGLSPFTKEVSPSFCVNEVKERFTCYSSQKSGNAVTFLMEHLNYSYVEAVESLASKYGKQVEYENPETAKKIAEKVKKKADLRPLLKTSLRKYQKAFFELPENHPAKNEVAFRGYDKETILDWEIGFAPGNKFIFNEMVEFSRKADAKEIGIINDYNDKYYNRLIYPIHDKRGFIVGFAGRDTSGGKTAKWINPSASVLYKKDKILFGLHKALKTIREKDEVWLVEGYNDVIAWHKSGILNTVSSSGTAITPAQIKELRRLCSSIVLCLDDDKAGKKAMLKYIPELLREGFSVWVVNLNGCDPDNFLRLYKDTIQKQPVTLLESDYNFRTEGFNYLLEEKLHPLEKLGATKAEIERNKITKELCKLIVGIPDEPARETYTNWLYKESNLSRTSINKWIKEETQILVDQESENDDYKQYEMPSEILKSFEYYQEDILQYGMFQENNKIWMLESSLKKYYFIPVSNFSIEVIQHMKDEKNPSKLIRIQNVNNQKAVFDVPSNSINTLQSFDNMVTDHGNFDFTGSSKHHRILRTCLMDKMGTGRKIETLGWQTEGFWCWNNKVIVPGKEDISIDENGVFEFKNIRYYVPSANQIYKDIEEKFPSQKRFREMKPSFSFRDLCAQMQTVHRGHAITSILYSITCIFRDVVINHFNNFPILFYFGTAGTGKDELSKACRSMLGEPQFALNLESGTSTSKAEVREFAQFANGLIQLSEYKRGPHDGMLKGVWDNTGYKRSEKDSAIANETIPIKSGVILTGNEFPEKKAVITRFIWEEIQKDQFSEEEIKEFQKLEKMINEGYSYFTSQILHLRELYIENFHRNYKEYKKKLTNEVEGIHSRVAHNLSILGATYEVLRNKINFSFTYHEMYSHIIQMVNIQQRKLESASIVNKFWDCFIASTKGIYNDRLQINREYKLEGTVLFFNFTNVYNRIAVQWRKLHNESAPNKNQMQDTLKRQLGLTALKNNKSIGGVKTSAHKIDLSKTKVMSELMNAMEWQLKDLGLPTHTIQSVQTQTEKPPPPNDQEIPF